MVGLIQYILFRALREEFSDEQAEQVLEAVNLPKDYVFRIDKNYPDEQWQAILAVLKKEFGLSAEEIEAFYATQFHKYVQELYPQFYQLSKNSYEFLLRQPIIHNSFLSGISVQEHGNVADKFHIEQFENKLITHYKSENKHCGLYKNLAHRIANHYNDIININEVKCMLQGDGECEIHVEWIKMS